MTQTQNKQKI